MQYLTEIQKLCQQNFTIKQIAEKLTISYMVVWHTIKKNNLTVKPSLWFDDRIVKEIGELLSAGKTYPEIAAMYGKKDYHILSLATKHGFRSVTRTPLNEAEKAQIQKLYSEGKSLKQIEGVIGKTDSTIGAFLQTTDIQTRPQIIRQKNAALREQGKRFCPTCEKVLLLEEFKTRICQRCVRKTENARYRMNRNNPTIETVAKQKLKSSKDRANKKGILFNLSLDDVLEIYTQQRGLCYYSGEPLSLEPGKYMLSIDRIDSAKGYSKENCALCLFKINIMKSDLDIPSFIELCKKVAEHNFVNPKT